MDTQVQSTTEWAREHGEEFTWWTPTNNAKPWHKRYETAQGEGWRYSLDDVRGSGIVLDGVSALKDYRESVYLIDDGKTVEVFYVTGWHPEGSHVILHPMPTNYHENGDVKRRANDGRPVDYSTWVLGPRRAYHVKVSAR